MSQPMRTIKPDAKGRICLGKLAEGISGFRIKVDKNHRIILEPLVEIPAREKWLFDNKPALQAVKQGIKDAKEGKVYDLGCIAKYLEDEDDDK